MLSLLTRVQPEPEPDRPEDCTTHTYTACNTKCSYGPSTSTCSSTCSGTYLLFLAFCSCVLTVSDVEGCTPPTDQSTATTATHSCPALPRVTNEWVPDDPNGAAPMLGDGGLNGYIETIGAGLTITSFNPTNGQTTANPPPTSTQRPFQNKYVYIAIERRFKSNADPFTSAYWVTYDFILGSGDPKDLCNTNPSTRKKVDANTAGYPAVTIGPFTVHGIEGCEYKGTDKNKIADITCPGMKPISCQPNTIESRLCEDDESTTNVVLECFF